MADIKTIKMTDIIPSRIRGYVRRKFIDVVYPVKQFISIIRNLCRWFPVIVKDRDWDDYYIWEILKFKLTNQAKYISSKDRHLSAQRDAQKMRLCVRLIEKIQSEYYCSEYMDHEEIEFAFIPSETSSKCKILDIKTIKDNLDDYFAKYPLQYKKLDKSQAKRSIAIKLAIANHNRAKKILFTLLETNIESWWD